jgi:phage major head subunit gpT-like protein
MANLGNAIQELREERSGTQLRLEKLDQAISAIESLNGTGVSQDTHQPTRIVSVASRRKMALAQKERWAKAKGNAASVKPKRTISAAGRKRIAAAQRARWAKLKAGKKAA